MLVKDMMSKLILQVMAIPIVNFAKCSGNIITNILDLAYAKDMKSESGKTPSDYAEEKGHTGIVEFLNSFQPPSK